MPEWNVQAGQTWEAEGALYHIIEVVRRDFFAPQIDLYDYLEIKKGRCRRERGHLTIRNAASNGHPDLWKRVA